METEYISQEVFEVAEQTSEPSTENIVNKKRKVFLNIFEHLLIPLKVVFTQTLPTPSTAKVEKSVPNGLPDLLASNLKLVIVGDNPGVTSATKQHHYSHPTNHFWSLLYESGLVTEKLSSNDDQKIINHGIGLTCMCPRTTVSSSELLNNELDSGYQALLSKLKVYKPKVVCFNGISIFEKVTNQKVV